MDPRDLISQPLSPTLRRDGADDETNEELPMGRIKRVSRVTFNADRMPAIAAFPETDSERYKACLDEQTTLGGKVGCFCDYMVALSDKSQL
jgi:hypothetical protein